MVKGITGVAGIEVGHYTDRAAATGCTVVICCDGAVAAVDVRGGAPGSRETELLRPGNLVERAHAVLISGGSSFGLDAAGGVMRYLEEQGVGFKLGPATIPIVPAAILFDLNLITGRVRPGPKEGYQACLASSPETVGEGSVGAGTGATVGKLRGMESATKGGIGTANLELSDGTIVGALVAVNAYGGIVDHRTGKVVAGPRKKDGSGFHDSVELLLNDDTESRHFASSNTTIAVVATSATLTKDQAHYLARVSHDGLALTIRPCHTIQDGDTVFALATGVSPTTPDLTQLGAAAVEVVAQSVLRAVEMAEGLGQVPSAKEVCHG